MFLSHIFLKRTEERSNQKEIESSFVRHEIETLKLLFKLVQGLFLTLS